MRPTRRIGVVGLDDPPHERVTDDVLGGEAGDADTLDALQDRDRMGKTRVGRVYEVDLARISSHRHPRSLAQSGEHHFHLEPRGILGFVDDNIGVRQGAATHEGDRRHLDFPTLATSTQGFAAQYRRQRLPDRGHIGIDFFVEIPGQETEAFAGLDRRASHDKSFDLAGPEQTCAMGDREEGFAGSRWAQSKNKVFAIQRLEIKRLGRRLGRHSPSTSGGAPMRRAVSDMVDGEADIGQRHLQPPGGVFGKHLKRPTRLTTGRRVTAQGHPSPRRLDENPKRILNQRHVTCAGPGHCSHRFIGEGYKLTHSASQADSTTRPARLLA